MKHFSQKQVAFELRNLCSDGCSIMKCFIFLTIIYEINLDNLINSSNISLSSAFADTALIAAFHILFRKRCYVYFHALCVINLTF